MNEPFLILPQKIITADNDNTILHNTAVEIRNGQIYKLYQKEELDQLNFQGSIYKFPGKIMIPGFVQGHVHLCQTLFRGLADDLELLDWLKNRIFPFENAHNADSLRLSAQIGLFELQTGGTTTILDMGTINHQEVIFEEFIRSNMNGFSGKCMVDLNDVVPEFKESKEDSIKSSYELAKSILKEDRRRLKYAFAPRFVLSCSQDLLIQTHEMMQDFDGSLYHTHASENLNEIKEVKKRFGKENIEYFDSIGVLSDRTILAHGIHVNDAEVDYLKNSKTSITHCPSANLKLGSGIANIPRYLKSGVPVSIGADGAPCNNNLSMFVEMRLASLIQKPFHTPGTMDALTVFRMATIEGARALHIGDQVGSIEEGKDADLVLLDLEKANQSLSESDDSIYSNIVYSAGRENVCDVFAGGEWVVRDGKSLIYDEMELISKGKAELNKLIRRANIN